MRILEIDDDLLEPLSAHYTETDLVVELENGTRLATPLWWYPPLLSASADQRSAIELSPYDVHWPRPDEDLSIEGMLKRLTYPGAVPPAQAAE